ncbi:MAG: DUF420 domain-containing protein [Bacteroidota bacterium]
MEKNLALAKKMNIGAIILSVVVLLLVGMMRQYKIQTSVDFSFLPPFHAFVNTLTAIALGMAFYFIKQKRIDAHQKAIYWALGFSAIFLTSYVVYHFTTEETRYCMEGNIRYVYFFFLITHVILAAGILPFIFFTFIRAYTGQIERHRAIARWVFPLWFYVAITGPVCYLMLRPCYT